MNETRYKELFESTSIGTMRLRNRIVMSPMHTKFASESGGVTDRLISYHVERAKGGVGLIVVENTCVDWELGRATGNPVTIHDDLFRGGLSDLVEAVHRHGAKIVPELHHAGRQNIRANTVGHKEPIAPSAIQSKVGGDEPRAMNEEEIENTIQQFVDGARRAKECGFDGIEFHGAHGYLLTQFLSPQTNHRTDKWGGTLENRARFALEIIRRTRTVVGPSFPLIYRLNVEDRTPEGLKLEEGVAFAVMLQNEGIDAIDVTAGIYESMPWIFTMQGTPPGSLVPLAAAVKQAVKIPVIAVSSLGWDPDLANNVIKSGSADLVSMGRTLLADPYWPTKVREDRAHEIRRCIRCNECVGFLFKGWRVHCVINAETGFEYLNTFRIPAKPKQVTVVGAGLAGLEYAITAARRGHKVTLLEKSNRIGGQTEERYCPSYKKNELGNLLKYYDAMLKKWGVDLRIGVAGTLETIANYRPDLVILALGSSPLPSKIPGAQHLPKAADVLAHGTDKIGQQVCVIGGDSVGVDAAIYLNDQKSSVTIIDGGSDILADVNPVLQWQLKNLLTERGIKVLTNHEVQEISGREVKASTNGKTITVGCDTVVVSSGFEPNDTSLLEKSLSSKGYQVRKIGTCRELGRIYDAIHGGFWAAIEV